MLREADDRAVRHLEEHRAELDRLVEALLQREELSREEIEQLMRTGKLDEPTNHEAVPDVTPAAV